MNKFMLNITASSGEYYQGDCEDLVLPISDGVYGIQAGHSPVLVALEMGIMQFTVNGETRNVLVGDGIAEVTPAYVVLLVDSAERPEDIDKNRAEAARIRDELYRRGVPRELWDEALETAPDAQETLACVIASKTRGKPLNEKDYKRLSDALLRRGFSWGEVKTALRTAGAALTDADDGL